MSKTYKKRTYTKKKKAEPETFSYQVITSDGKTHIIEALNYQEAIHKLKKFNY